MAIAINWYKIKIICRKTLQMTEIIHNYPAGKDGTIIFGPWEDAEVNNHMAYYIENIINFAIHKLFF